MQTVNDIMDKVDTDLMKLIEANNDFTEYKKLQSTTVSERDVSLKGSLGLMINPKHILGLSIYSRG